MGPVCLQQKELCSPIKFWEDIIYFVNKMLEFLCHCASSHLPVYR